MPASRLIASMARSNKIQLLSGELVIMLLPLKFWE